MTLLSKAISNSHLAFKNFDAFLLFLPGKVDHVQQDGYNFLFHYYNPHVNNTSSNPPVVEKRDRLMPPYEPHIELGHFKKNGASHFLILNRYQFAPGHLIMVLDDQSELQGSPLMPHDYSMLSQVIPQLNEKGLFYYNGGVDAGCTQYHKHMQFVPSYENPLLQTILEGKRLPIKYFKYPLSDYRASTIGYAYNKLLEQMNHSGSYNFIISRKTAMIFPRRQARHNSGVLVNSMGCLGHFFVWNYNCENAKKDPVAILKDCGIPVDD